MDLKTIYRSCVNLGEAAEQFAIEHAHYPFVSKEGNRVSLNAVMRDLANQVEHSIKALSPATLDQIARS